MRSAADLSAGPLTQMRGATRLSGAAVPRLQGAAPWRHHLTSWWCDVRRLTGGYLVFIFELDWLLPRCRRAAFASPYHAVVHLDMILLTLEDTNRISSLWFITHKPEVTGRISRDALTIWLRTNPPGLQRACHGRGSGPCPTFASQIRRLWCQRPAGGPGRERWSNIPEPAARPAAFGLRITLGVSQPWSCRRLTDTRNSPCHLRHRIALLSTG